MGRTRASSSSSSIDSTNHFGFSTTAASSSSSSHRDFNTDLSLGLSISVSPPGMVMREPESEWAPMKAVAEDQEYECNSSTFFVKVYMEGIPIGRKLDLLAHHSYYDLITTVERMFNTRIIWAEAEVDEGDYYYEKYHVLTYEDKEGDWMMLGDVPWEMFLSAVRRLKIGKC